MIAYTVHSYSYEHTTAGWREAKLRYPGVSFGTRSYETRASLEPYSPHYSYEYYRYEYESWYSFSYYHFKTEIINFRQRYYEYTYE
eukprot:scaffold177605_cov55-Prasinocladus_malaysianus.AAC.1